MFYFMYVLIFFSPRTSNILSLLSSQNDLVDEQIDGEGE